MREGSLPGPCGKFHICIKHHMGSFCEMFRSRGIIIPDVTKERG